MEQVTKAVKIAEVKYPTSQKYHHIWCFDHSCNHTAFSEYALIASKMNKVSGGKQPKWTATNHDSARRTIEGSSPCSGGERL